MRPMVNTVTTGALVNLVTIVQSNHSKESKTVNFDNKGNHNSQQINGEFSNHVNTGNKNNYRNHMNSGRLDHQRNVNNKSTW
jgi:hypothetical protein